MKPHTRNASFRCLFALVLAFALCLPAAGIASAADDEASVANPTEASTAVQEASPCVPSAEDIAAWEADGTLEERIAFQESLGNSTVSSSLIEQAKAREAGAHLLSTEAGNNLPAEFDNDLSMSTTGKARVLALYVDFPISEESNATLGFAEGDTLSALQNLIGAPLQAEGAKASNSNDSFAPYDSLHAYYERSSYGKLDISGTAVEYTAKHPRSYYDYRLNELFTEALGALDAEIEYRNYDANGDGAIDAVYLHFAGNSSGWGSTWWSNCSFYDNGEGGPCFDGTTLGCIITLHQPSNTEEGVRTAIHETGHALGLPDYYSYNANSVKRDPSYRTGILTFDMMNTNIGDHNAYSKWLLGWIDDSKITRIVANEDGITVKRGGEVIQTVAPSKGASPLVEAELDLLATNSSMECGGFIAVSDSESLLDAQGLFSSFYLLEYNGPYGNQIVSYRAGFEDGHDIHQPLPSGFRLFRLQAELDETGFSFVHMNKADDVHNQFIELVDHDADEQHFEFIGFADGTGSAPYECMMTEGDAIGPAGVTNSASGHSASYPSTNFYESLSMGFTGLAIKVTESSAVQGKVSISYEGELKPDISPSSLNFALADKRGVDNIDVIELESTMPVMRVGDGMVYVKAKERCVAARVEEVNRTSITVSYAMPPELFVPGESCELVFPAGYFFIGKKNGENVYSDELRVKLPVGNTVGFDEVGDYASAASDSHVISNVVTASDGITYFAIQDKGRISLCAIDPSDPTEAQTSAIQGVGSETAYRLRLEPLSDGGLCLIATSYLSGKGTCNEAYWLDPATSSAKADVKLNIGDVTAVNACGDTLMAIRFTPANNYYETPSSLEIEAYEPASDDFSPIGTWKYTSVGSVHEVANAEGEIALTGNPYSPHASLAKIIDLATLMDEGSSGQAVDFPNAKAKTTLDATGHSGLSAFARYDDGYLGLAYDNPAAAGSPDTANGSNAIGAGTADVPAWRGKTDLKAYLVAFDGNGAARGSYLFGTFPTQGAPFDSLSVSPEGVPAAEICLDANKGGNIRRVLFFRDSIASAPITLSTESSADGTWLSNDAWLETSFNFPLTHFFAEEDLNDSMELAGYEQESDPVHYLVAFMPGDEGDGDDFLTDSGDADPDSGAEDSMTPDAGPDSGTTTGGNLLDTGDAAGTAVVVFAITAIMSLALALVAMPRLAAERRHQGNRR